jgi:hypothetical protein
MLKILSIYEYQLLALEVESVQPQLGSWLAGLARGNQDRYIHTHKCNCKNSLEGSGKTNLSGCCRRQLPSWLLVLGPFDEVLELTVTIATVHTGVQHGIGIPFLLSTDIGWRWRFLALAGVTTGRRRRTQYGDVEDGMDVHTLGEIQMVGIRRDGF